VHIALTLAMDAKIISRLRNRIMVCEDRSTIAVTTNRLTVKKPIQ